LVINVSGLYEKKYTIEGARQKLKQLQDNGQPLNVHSLEEPVAAVPAPPVKPMEKPGTLKPVASAQGDMTPESYKKFLTNLRTELKQLIELIDS
jgi:hypothetical protein